ncbi:hypothetical protein [Mucisphaera sp.]|uniref:hypothetical protein n=1 Tax=Mucisphaera sp. TaxID=2913024 RepID=UPI003D104CB2
MSGKPIDDNELLENAIPIPHEEEEEEAMSLEPIEVSAMDDTTAPKKISSFAERESKQVVWKRAPLKTGTGACHVKTFVTKLRLDAIEHIDEQVNQWLDENPDYEVKFVTTSIGKLVGKTSEDALFMSVWV